MRFSTALLLATVAACTDLTGAADLSVGGSSPDGAGANGAAGAAGANGGVPGNAPGGVPTIPGFPVPPSFPDAGFGNPLAEFDFVDVTGAALATSYTSSATILSAFGQATVSGGDAQLSADSATWGASVSVLPGKKLFIKMTSSETPSTPITATVTVGATKMDWVVATGAVCPPQPFTWPATDASATTCTLSTTDPLDPGASAPLSISNGTPTGAVTVTCTNGVLVASKPTCGIAKTFDVANPTACQHAGYCSATLRTSCSPLETLADRYCIVQGYAAHTAETTVNQPTGATQCPPDDGSCYSATDANCNKVFSSITCRY